MTRGRRGSGGGGGGGGGVVRGGRPPKGAGGVQKAQNEGGRRRGGGAHVKGMRSRTNAACFALPRSCRDADSPPCLTPLLPGGQAQGKKAAKEKPKTREELDAELDAYKMKDSKARPRRAPLLPHSERSMPPRRRPRPCCQVTWTSTSRRNPPRSPPRTPPPQRDTALCDASSVSGPPNAAPDAVPC